MIAPGTRLIEFGLITPVSTAVYTPAIVSEAFLSVSSNTRFRVFISGSAVRTGPRPYLSFAAFMYLAITQGNDLRSL